MAARNVSRVFGEGGAAVQALDDVSVDFPSGRLTAIMGPSGSGKSTLMHCLAGLDRPTSGTVTIDGVELGSLDDANSPSFAATRSASSSSSSTCCRY